MNTEIEEKDLKTAIIDAIKEKKGEEIVLIDLTEIEQAIAEYFVVCHANSNTQVEAIADNVERYVRTVTPNHEHPMFVEGTQNAQWVLLDYGDIIVHVFQEQYRRFYDIESLWADAKCETINDEE
ncbi:MAG: ribosome silencing factor [Salinivirgaceae bacterium]|nr:ribosome silencing factor [Salinivirgaceae bacterium]